MLGTALQRAFTKEPILNLRTAEAVRNAIVYDGWHKRDNDNRMTRWEIKSDWLIALIDEIAATGQYPNNHVIQNLAEERLGLPLTPHGSNTWPLGTLVYNAQQYRDADKLKADGFVPGNDAILADAYQRKAKLEVPGGDLLNVKMIEGKLYAVKPRKRKYYVDITNQPVRMVA